MAKSADELKKLEAQQRNIDTQRNAAADKLYEVQTKTATTQAEIQARQRDITKAQKEYNDLLNVSEIIYNRINKLQEKNYETESSLTQKLQERIKYLTREVKKQNFLQRLVSSKNKSLKQAAKLETKINELHGDLNKLTKKELQQLVQQVDEYNNIDNKVQSTTEKIREQQEIWEAAKKSASDFLGDVSAGIAKLPLIGKALSDGFNTFLKSDSGKKIRNKIAKKLFDPKAIGKSIKGAIGLGLVTAGVGMISAGIGGLFKREQELKDQQRSLGLTKEQSIAVDTMQRGLLNTSGNMITSLEDARKASAELIDTFGEFGAENSKMVEQQVALTKAYHLSGEEANDFQKAAMISGQSTEEMKIDILATAEGFNKAKGSSYSLSSVMKTVSKLSDSVRLQFRGSNTELTAAVMKAKALGTTLEDLNGIADNLLNIESSIEAQVTAQLVTGRNITMDKARMFALMDDMPGLMDELVKQEIDYNSYSKMNRIEKQSTAAALGMNTDQMAKFVSQQELSKQLNIDMSDTQNQTALGLENSLKSRQEEIAQLAKAGNMAALQYEKDNEALTQQEKMTAAVEQMNNIFTKMAPVLIGLGVAATIFGLAMAKAAFAAAGIAIGISGGGAALGIVAGIVAAGAAYKMIGMATGGEVVGGSGPVVVGENGPEIVRLKKGNMVTPNDQLTNLASNNKPAPAPIVNVSLVVGNTAINEIGNKISMNQNYNQGVGNTYNRLG